MPLIADTVSWFPPTVLILLPFLGLVQVSTLLHRAMCSEHQSQEIVLNWTKPIVVVSFPLDMELLHIFGQQLVTGSLLSGK